MTPREQQVYRRVFEAGKSLLQRPAQVRNLAQRGLRNIMRHRDELGQIARDLGTMMRLLKAWSDKRYTETPWKSLVAIVGAVLYFVMPLDAVPDFIAGLGLLDDIAVVGMVTRQVRKDLDQFRLWEALEEAAGADQEPSAERRSWLAGKRSR